MTIPRPDAAGAAQILYLLKETMTMDSTNAFLGHKKQPTEAAVAAVLGASAELWQQFVDWIAQKQSIDQKEWRSVPKYGWTLRLKTKSKTIVYLGPSTGCFRVYFILGPKALVATRESQLPKDILQAIDDAPRHPDGTGVAFVIRRECDLAGIRELVHIKLTT